MDTAISVGIFLDVGVPVLFSYCQRLHVTSYCLHAYMLFLPCNFIVLMAVIFCKADDASQKNRLSAIVDYFLTNIR